MNNGRVYALLHAIFYFPYVLPGCVYPPTHGCKASATIGGLPIGPTYREFNTVARAGLKPENQSVYPSVRILLKNHDPNTTFGRIFDFDYYYSPPNGVLIDYPSCGFEPVKMDPHTKYMFNLFFLHAMKTKTSFMHTKGSSDCLHFCLKIVDGVFHMSSGGHCLFACGSTYRELAANVYYETGCYTGINITAQNFPYNIPIMKELKTHESGVITSSYANVDWNYNLTGKLAHCYGNNYTHVAGGPEEKKRVRRSTYLQNYTMGNINAPLDLWGHKLFYKVEYGDMFGAGGKNFISSDEDSDTYVKHIRWALWDIYKDASKMVDWVVKSFAEIADGFKTLNKNNHELQVALNYLHDVMDHSIVQDQQINLLFNYTRQLASAESKIVHNQNFLRDNIVKASEKFKELMTIRAKNQAQADINLFKFTKSVLLFNQKELHDLSFQNKRSVTAHQKTAEILQDYKTRVYPQFTQFLLDKYKAKILNSIKQNYFVSFINPFCALAINDNWEIVNPFVTYSLPTVTTYPTFAKLGGVTFDPFVHKRAETVSWTVPTPGHKYGSKDSGIDLFSGAADFFSSLGMDIKEMGLSFGKSLFSLNPLHAIGGIISMVMAAGLIFLLLFCCCKK